MRVGRFQVMAVLQAARAKRLGLSVAEAKSWGLNRAIFYAAAKRGFKEKRVPGRGKIARKLVEERRVAYYLGDEMAYSSQKAGDLYFMIGGKLQTVSDFERQIAGRFGDAFRVAWKESFEIMRQYPKEVLLSQNRFFQDVYRPRRDELASKWTEMSESNEHKRPK